MRTQTQGGEHHTSGPVGGWGGHRRDSTGWGDRGGITLGEILNVGDRGMDAANHHGICIPM